MNILLLEDRNDISTEIIRKLNIKGHSVTCFSSVGQAQQYFYQNTYDSINAIIFDNNMAAKSLLNDELIELSDGGNFTGWIWLYHLQCLNHKEEFSKIKLIMYSGYANDMKNYFSKINNPMEENYFMKKVFSIVKGTESIARLILFLEGENYEMDE